MPTLTNKQSRAINSVGPNYSINYEADAEAGVASEELERLADSHVLDATAATARDDIGGLVVYWRGDELVGFYDYERYVGHVF